jgi:DNA repair exonuclease SbcCD ATPase subunit
MPRAPIITSEAVAHAAGELLAQGKPVTNVAVLELIGGGSMSTLVPLLRAWREDQKERCARDEVDLPDPVLEQVRDLATRIWRDATEEAQAAADALRRDLRDLRQEAEQQQGELVAHLGTLEAERDTAKEQRDELLIRIEEFEAEGARVAAELTKAEATIESLREKCAFLQTALTTAEERADRAEQRLVEILQTMKAGMNEDRTSSDGPAGSDGAV